MDKTYTKEDIKNILTALQRYSGWMYFSEEGVSKFSKANVCNTAGEPMKIVLRDDGLIELLRLKDGVSGLFDVRFVTGTVKPNTLHGCYLNYRFLNEQSLSPEDREFFLSYQSFVGSFFQRMISFTFLANMHKDTVESIVNDLFLVISEEQSQSVSLTE